MKKSNIIITILITAFSVVTSNITFAEKLYFNEKTAYEVCFTPGQNCTQLIVDEINHAKKSLYVQAYSFTSAPIAKAIVDAKRRGVDVKVILDKSQIKRNRYSSAKFLMNQGVPVWIDYKVNIAHNKIILIDMTTLITGSFNFTQGAQKRNAENILMISNANLVKSYYDNWKRRLSHSVTPEKYTQDDSIN